MGIGGKLLWSFIVIVLLSAVMGGVAWNGFSSLAEREQQVTGHTIPDLVTARKLSELSSEIIFTAQSLANAKTEAERQEKGRELSVSGRVLAGLQANFSFNLLEQEELKELEQVNIDIIANLAILGREVGKRIELQEKLKIQQQRLQASVLELARLARSQVANTNAITMANITRMYDLVPENDRDKLNEGLDQLVEVDMDQLQRISALELRIYQLLNLLSQQEKVVNTKNLEQILNRCNRLINNIHYLANSVEDPDRREKMQQQLIILKEANTTFINRAELIQVNDRISQLNKGNIFLLSSLNRYVGMIVDKSEQMAITSGNQLRFSLESGRAYVVLIFIITLILMIWIVWQVVYKHLVRRLVNHTETLGKLAKGDLTATAEGSGEDELADMARAIEIFRRNAITKAELEQQQAAYQEELTEHRDNLKSLVSAQTRQLKSANTELAEKAEMYRQAQSEAEKASEAKTRFLAHMSHEIRTPMNGVLGMLALLKHTTLNPQQKDYVQAIGYSSEILLDILNDILDYSKIEAGFIENKPFNFSPSSLLEELVSLMSGRAASKKLTLSLTVDSAVPDWLLGDGVKIRQILLNLIGNAIKFTDHGKVAVSLTADENKGFWRFDVVDTGAGIPDDKINEIFAAFGQATQNLKQPGTGLGLAISQKLVDVMGGGLEVESQPGKGSRFHFSIPMSEGQAEVVETFSVSLTNRYTVLLVEDNDVSRTVAEGYLAHLGQKVVSAASCAEAREKITQDSFDLVLMDINLPDGNGVDLAAELRKKTTETLPIVAVSAHVFKEDQQQFIEQGLNACLGKPLRVEALAKVMTEVLSGVQPEQREPNLEHRADIINKSQLSDDLDVLGKDVIQYMAHLFMESSEKLMAELNDAEADNHELICKVAHELKGAAGSMALPAFQEQAAMIERKASLQEDTRHSVAELQVIHSESCHKLRQWLIKDIPATLR